MYIMLSVVNINLCIFVHLNNVDLYFFMSDHLVELSLVTYLCDIFCLFTFSIQNKVKCETFFFIMLSSYIIRKFKLMLIANFI